MSAIVLVLGNPNPQGADQLKAYQGAAGPLVAKHGGQVVFRGQVVSSLTNSRSWKVSLAIRFPDEAAAIAWYADPDYQKAIALRNEAFSDLEINLVKE